MSPRSSRVAVVTGANRGIGFETARQLAGHGVRVRLAGRDRAAVDDAAATLVADGLDVAGLYLDVTSTSSIAAAVAEVVADRGRLDILVNNAGIRTEEYGRAPSEQPMARWQEAFATNVFGMVETTVAFLPLLRASPRASIVNVSSLLGSVGTHGDPTSYTHTAAFKSLPAYSASKSAVNSWTVHLAWELRDTPVKVNAVHPGYTRTALNDGAGDQDVEDGACTSVRMALVDGDGPSGTYVHGDRSVPW